MKGCENEIDHIIGGLTGAITLPSWLRHEFELRDKKKKANSNKRPLRLTLVSTGPGHVEALRERG